MSGTSGSARAHVVISEEVLARIDRHVGQRARSRFIEEAAREKLDRLALEEALKATAGIAGSNPRWRDRVAARRWVRRLRRESDRP